MYSTELTQPRHNVHTQRKKPRQVTYIGTHTEREGVNVGELNVHTPEWRVHTSSINIYDMYTLE